MGLQISLRASTLATIQRLLFSGSTFFFVGFMLANLISYVYQMLVSRMLSPADYGIVIALASIFDVLAVVLRSAQASVVEAVAASGDPRAQQPRAVFNVAIRRLATLGGIAFAGHWLGGVWIAGFLHLGTTTPVIILGAYVLFSFLASVTFGLVLGLNRLHLAGLILLLESTVRLVTGVSLVNLGLGVNGAMAGFAIGGLVLFGIALLALWPVLTSRRAPATLTGDKTGLNRYALVALVANTCLMAMVSIDQLLVKHFFSEEVAGNYAVAFLLGRILGMSTIALGWVIFTHSATMPSNDPRRRGLLIKGLLVTGVIAVTMTSGFLALPVQTVELMSGSQYSTASSYLGLVGIEMSLFAFVYVQVYYHLAVRNTQVIWPLILATMAEFALLAQFHATVFQIQMSLIVVMAGLLIYVSNLSWRLTREKSASLLSSGGPAKASTSALTGQEGEASAR